MLTLVPSRSRRLRLASAVAAATRAMPVEKSSWRDRTTRSFLVATTLHRLSAYCWRMRDPYLKHYVGLGLIALAVLAAGLLLLQSDEPMVGGAGSVLAMLGTVVGLYAMLRARKGVV